MSTQSEARQDAREFARAAMFYGEGAGTRRKLITASVETKSKRSSAYERAFHQELSKQDMGEHAVKAKKERRRIDAMDSTRRNTRAIATGNYHNAQTSVLILLAAATIAHKTGFDVVVYNKTKQTCSSIKNTIKNRRKNPDPSPVYNIYSGSK